MSKNNLLMPLITNPVKIAALNYIRMKGAMEEISNACQYIDNHVKNFTPEQFEQYIKLITSSIPWDSVSDYSSSALERKDEK